MGRHSDLIWSLIWSICFAQLLFSWSASVSLWELIQAFICVCAHFFDVCTVSLLIMPLPLFPKSLHSCRVPEQRSAASNVLLFTQSVCSPAIQSLGNGWGTLDGVCVCVRVWSHACVMRGSCISKVIIEGSFSLLIRWHYLIKSDATEWLEVLMDGDWETSRHFSIRDIRVYVCQHVSVCLVKGRGSHYLLIISFFIPYSFFLLSLSSFLIPTSTTKFSRKPPSFGPPPLRFSSWLSVSSSLSSSISPSFLQHLPLSSCPWLSLTFQ